MAIAETVFRLEQLDTELEGREAELRDTQRRRQRNPELEAARARLAQLTAFETAAAAENRSAEADLGVLEERMKRTQARMYGGLVVDPRELSSLEKELEHAAAQRDALEDRSLEAMERLESFQSQVAETRERVSTLEQEWESAKPGLAQHARDVAAAIASLKQQREPLVAELDPRTLDMYTRLRASLGHAVSQVSSGICGWCRVSIPQKDVQHARGNAIVGCPNCRRILYVGR